MSLEMSFLITTSVFSKDYFTYLFDLSNLSVCTVVDFFHPKRPFYDFVLLSLGAESSTTRQEEQRLVYTNCYSP